MNKSLTVDLHRMQSEFDMVLNQIEFCSQSKKEKEQEIFNNIKQKEAIEKILWKSQNKLQTDANEDLKYINTVTEKIIKTNDL